MRTGILVSLAFALALGGCATVSQAPVAFSPHATTVEGKPGRIGIAMTAMPKVGTELPGANCLLCLAAASLANSSLSNYSKTLPYEDLGRLKEDAAELLRGKGLDVVVIPEALNIAALPKNKTKAPNATPRDFSSLKVKYGIDELLVFQVDSVGFVRPYAAYVPTGEPKGTVSGLGYMVDLGSNRYDWYQPVSVAKSADGKWDEPPSFPGLTNAYFQAVALGHDAFLQLYPVEAGVGSTQ